MLCAFKGKTFEMGTTDTDVQEHSFLQVFFIKFYMLNSLTYNRSSNHKANYGSYYHSSELN